MYVYVCVCMRMMFVFLCISSFKTMFIKLKFVCLINYCVSTPKRLPKRLTTQQNTATINFWWNNLEFVAHNLQNKTNKLGVSVISWLESIYTLSCVIIRHYCMLTEKYHGMIHSRAHLTTSKQNTGHFFFNIQCFTYRAIPCRSNIHCKKNMRHFLSTCSWVRDIQNY